MVDSEQEKLMAMLLELASGDIGTVKRAFRSAPRVPGDAPELSDVVLEIVAARGLFHLVADLRRLSPRPPAAEHPRAGEAASSSHAF